MVLGFNVSWARALWSMDYISANWGLYVHNRALFSACLNEVHWAVSEV